LLFLLDLIWTIPILAPETLLAQVILSKCQRADLSVDEAGTEASIFQAASDEVIPNIDMCCCAHGGLDFWLMPEQTCCPSLAQLSQVFFPEVLQAVKPAKFLELLQLWLRHTLPHMNSEQPASV
jgi:hypothetical protein